MLVMSTIVRCLPDQGDVLFLTARALPAAFPVATLVTLIFFAAGASITAVFCCEG